jgi:hypothetical protein
VQVIEEWGYDMGEDACRIVDDRAVPTPGGGQKTYE